METQSVKSGQRIVSVIAVIVMVISFFAVFTANMTEAYAATKTTITYSSISGPGVIDEGNGNHIKGTIKSTGSKLSSVKAVVTNSAGKTVLSKTVYPKAYTYSLYDSKLDNALTFGSLSTGQYTLKYTAKTTSGVSKTKSLTFHVVDMDKAYSAIVFAKSGLSLRSSAKITSSNKVATAPAGTELTVLSVSGDFAKILYNGKIRYCLKKYLDKTYYTGYTTAPKGLYLRDKASTAGNKVYCVAQNTPVTVLSSTGNWYKVAYKNQILYCSKVYVSDTSLSDAYTAIATLNSGLNIRSSAKITDTNKVGTVPAGTEMTVFSVSGDYAKVLYDGRVRYCVNKYLDKSYYAATTTASKGLNLRTAKKVSDDTKYACVKKGTKVIVLSTSGEWSKIIYDNKILYCDKDFLKKDTGALAYDIDGVLAQTKKDIGKNRRDLGYDGPWCTYYVSDLLNEHGFPIERCPTPCDLVLSVLNSGRGTYYSFRQANIDSLIGYGLKSTKNVVSTSRSKFNIKKGDIIIYLWNVDKDNDFNWSHVGFVREDHTSGNIRTAEGNTTDSYVVAHRNDRAYDSTVVGILRLTK